MQKLLLVLALATLIGATNDFFDVGTGIGDVTGPANSEGMMGYALLQQRTAGIHFRLRARAFIFVSQENGKRFVFVNLDIALVTRAITQNVVAALKKKYGDLYTDDNVIISAIHTHSGPGGYSYNIIFDTASLGADAKHIAAIVDGIVTAIDKAHNSIIKDCRVRISTDELTTDAVNRSPTSYTANPPEERAEYDYDTDKDVVVLRIEDKTGKPVAMMNWHAVHGVSMPNTNTLISGDNKGAAMMMVEEMFNGPDALPGEGPFIASFSQPNEGDATPNIKGAFCPNGDHCDMWYSTCDGNSDNCRGQGPYGKEWFENTKAIAQIQVEKSLELFNNTQARALSGPIDFRHMFIKYDLMHIDKRFTTTGKDETTCKPGFGYSMAAGTTDGPGGFKFFQGDNSTTNPFWELVKGMLKKPTPEQIKCQHPKEVLIDFGEMDPVWSPRVLPVQVVRLGQLYIAAVPVEMTTMSGRRLKKMLKQAIKEGGGIGEEPYVLIAGLSNEYSDYCATYEEYQYQRYEGGSTAFGPHTLAAHLQSFYWLARNLTEGTPVEKGTPPPDLAGKVPNLNPPVIADGHPPFKPFGSVHQDVKKSYSRSKEPRVEVVFWGANLRNNYMNGKTFLAVERLDAKTNQWKLYRNDGHWDTQIHWSLYMGVFSKIRITWDISKTTPVGKYRIRHFGYQKPLGFAGKKSVPYEGASSSFVVA